MPMAKVLILIMHGLSKKQARAATLLRMKFNMVGLPDLEKCSDQTVWSRYIKFGLKNFGIKLALVCRLHFNRLLLAAVEFLLFFSAFGTKFC